MPVPVRARTLFYLPAACALILLLFIEFPGQVSPALKLQFIDENGNGIPNIRGTWSGGFSRDSFEEEVTADVQGCLVFPARSVRESLSTHIQALLGTNQPFSRIMFELPAGHRFDQACVEGTRKSQQSFNWTRSWPAGKFAKGSGSSCEWDLADGTWVLDFSEYGGGGPEMLDFRTNKPASSGTSQYRLVVHRRPVPVKSLGQPGGGSVDLSTSK